MSGDLPFTIQEFDSIYSRVPRLTVEVLLVDPDKGVYLTLRGIEPNKGQWHLAGGTVLFGESLEDAVKRVAGREIGIDVLTSSFVGIIDYRKYDNNCKYHDVGLVYRIDNYGGSLSINDEAIDGKWHKKVPDPIIAIQGHFLVEHDYLQA